MHCGTNGGRTKRLLPSVHGPLKFKVAGVHVRGTKRVSSDVTEHSSCKHYGTILFLLYIVLYVLIKKHFFKHGLVLLFKVVGLPNPCPTSFMPLFGPYGHIWYERLVKKDITDA